MQTNNSVIHTNLSKLNLFSNSVIIYTVAYLNYSLMYIDSKTNHINTSIISHLSGQKQIAQLNAQIE